MRRIKTIKLKLENRMIRIYLYFISYLIKKHLLDLIFANYLTIYFKKCLIQKIIFFIFAPKMTEFENIYPLKLSINKLKRFYSIFLKCNK